MENKIKELYENGLNYKEIGLKLNKDPRTIKKIIIGNGFKQLNKIRRCKYVLNEDYLTHILDKQLWFLGLMAADGYIINNKTFGIAQSGDDGKTIIEYIKNELEYSGPIYESKTIGDISYSLTITSDKLVDIFSDYNIIRKKSLIYQFPKLNEENEIKDFIRGYIDGDGSVGVYDNGKGYKYLVISFVGTEDFIKCVGNKISIKSSSIRKLSLAENCYEIRWYGKKAIEFGNWVFSNKNLFNSKKNMLFEIYIIRYSPNFLKYESKKIEVKELVNSGEKVSEIVKITGIPFQTIYKWKKEF